MPIELSDELHAVLEETRAVDTPAEFDALLAAARPEMDRIVREVLGPAQAMSTTLTALRDLYQSIRVHEAHLTEVSYTPLRRELFRDALRLLATAALWFGEGQRTGVYRARTVAEIVEQSRPFRARLSAYAGHAFAFEPEKADRFADVNSSGTLEEEVEDLHMLLFHARKEEGRLRAVGMKEDFLLAGEALLREAEERGLLRVLGIRNAMEAGGLRNRILTYAVLLGREARGAGINGCFEDEEARRQFEVVSFRDMLRRSRPRRKGGGGGEEDAPEEGKPHGG